MLPFVELEQELWNRDQTRLTLLFDPGRIKRGVKPNVDMGPVLLEGHRYTLVIDRDLKDANGAPLAKRLSVTSSPWDPPSAEASIPRTGKSPRPPRQRSILW